MWLCWLCVDCECFVECFFEYFILSVHTLCWLWILCWVWLWILYVDCIYFVLTVNILHRLWIFCIECVYFVLTENTSYWLWILCVDCVYFVLTVTTLSWLNVLCCLWLWILYCWFQASAELCGPMDLGLTARASGFCLSEMWQWSLNNKFGVLNNAFLFISISVSLIHPAICLSSPIHTLIHPIVSQPLINN